MTSPHVFHLGAAPPVPVGGVARIGATAADLPLLADISAVVLTLAPGAVEGPRWYANAGLLAYCTQGAALVTILSPGNVRDCFTLGADEIFFVERGFAYSIHNASAAPAQLVALLSHERPVACAPAALIGAPSVPVCGSAAAPRVASPHRFALREIGPSACAGGAVARAVTSDELSILDGLALGTLSLLPSKVAEPHWHPNCGELGYVLGGRGRMALVSPAGVTERSELRPGDLYYVPPAYAHWQESFADDTLNILIGFAHHEPLTIELANAAAAFPARTQER